MPIIFLNKIGFQLQVSENIRDLCIGECIEVGAYSRPAVLPYATSIRYADIHTVAEAKKFLKNVIIFDITGPSLLKLILFLEIMSLH